MIALRRGDERHHDQKGRQEGWRTFSSEEGKAPLAAGFGILESLREDCLPPGATIENQPHRDAEVVTYVREGAVAYEDSTGRSGVVQAGEFQRRASGRRLRHSESNASQTVWAHVFQLWLRPSGSGPGSPHEQKRFTAAERRNGLCVVASPDARRGSLRIHQDARIYSAMLHPGQHLVHELAQGRIAWVHLVKGEATLGDIVLMTGDGAGLTAERAVSLTAREESEILLLDLDGQSSNPNSRGDSR